MDFVEIKTMKQGYSEHKSYLKIKKKYKFMGSGEAAVIALTCKNGGVIASNNLVEVRGFAEDYDLKLITTAFILAKAYEFGIKKRKELDKIWQEMIKNGRKRSLPRNVKSFTDYYSGKYVDDCLFMSL